MIRGFLLAMILVALAYAFSFLVFVSLLPPTPTELPQADGIVALTGGDDYEVVATAPAFLPVHLTGEPVSRDLGRRSRSLAVSPETPSSADAQIEIMLADGTLVRAGQNVGLATLRRVLAALRG